MLVPRHRPRYVYRNEPTPPEDGRRRKKIIVPVLLFTAAAVLLSGFFFLRDLSTQIAVSDAEDIVTMAVNKAVNDVLSGGDYSYDYFIDIEKDNSGQVTAISCDMAHINIFSTEILNKVIHSTESGTMTVNVPLGNLTGASLLMGRGPKIPIQIIYLTSSSVRLKNDLVSAGINQTKLQLYLEVTVDVDILIPWSTQSTEVVTDVLVADTVVVGKVPDTFISTE